MLCLRFRSHRRGFGGDILVSVASRGNSEVRPTAYREDRLWRWWLDSGGRPTSVVRGKQLLMFSGMVVLMVQCKVPTAQHSLGANLPVHLQRSVTVCLIWFR